VDLERITELTDGFSGANVAAIPNTAASIVLHRHLVQYPTPEEASNHASEAQISASDFVDAIKKIKEHREMKKNEKLSTSHYM